MRNSILSAALIASAIMGGLVGGNIRDMQIQDEIHDAWSDVVIVKDGQLIANPSYYAFNPDELANAENVRIIDGHTAALDQAFNRTPRLIGFGCKGLKTPAMGVEESDFPTKCDAIVPIEQLPNRG